MADFSVEDILMENKLWTKDFTIITLGSVVSMIGNALASFAMSLFVLDFTGSTLYYSIYIFLYTLPQIAAPVISGPLMDRFSRRRTIYWLDFAMTALYIFLGAMVYFDVLNFGIFAAAVFVSGMISSVYNVAFQSFFPMLISEGNYTKAYSISSALETLTFVMIPVSAFVYNTVGLCPLLIANALCFLAAALFEMRISDVEGKNVLEKPAEYGGGQYIKDMREGVRYLFSEKGLLAITLYFTVISFSGGASQVITLPWFRGNFENGEYIYTSVWAFMVIGRVLGGMLHYKIKLPTDKKYAIALFVYVSIALLEGFYLYTPIIVMQGACFLNGLLSVTSYNIRISATQYYVPNERKGRYNGTFMMLNTVGALLGQLLAGTLSEFLPTRMVLTCFMVFSAVSALVIIGGNKKHVVPIYNRQA